MQCANCKGPIASQLATSCEYCGSPIAERMASVSGGTEQSALAALDQNIEALEALPQPTLWNIAYGAFYWVLNLTTLTILPSVLSLKPPKPLGASSFKALKAKIERNIADAREVLGSDELAQKKLARISAALVKAESSVDRTRKIGYFVRVAAVLVAIIPISIALSLGMKIIAAMGTPRIAGSDVSETPEWLRGDWVTEATEGEPSHYHLEKISFTANTVVKTDGLHAISTENLGDAVLGADQFQAKVGSAGFRQTCTFARAGAGLVVSGCLNADGQYRREAVVLAQQGEDATQTPEWLRGRWQLPSVATRESRGNKCDYQITISTTSINVTGTLTRGERLDVDFSEYCESRGSNVGLGTRSLSTGIVQGDVFKWTKTPAELAEGMDAFLSWTCRFERVGEDVLVSDCGPLDGSWTRN